MIVQVASSCRRLLSERKEEKSIDAGELLHACREGAQLCDTESVLVNVKHRASTAHRVLEPASAVWRTGGKGVVFGEPSQPAPTSAWTKPEHTAGAGAGLAQLAALRS